MKHTTTVRFDTEIWTRLKRVCEELGIPAAEYIRVAVIQRLERGDIAERVTGLESRMTDIEVIVERLSRLWRRWLERRLHGEAVPR